MMIKDISSLDPNKLYTYSDYLKWQFTERVELIKGKIFKMSPAPSTRHQEISVGLIGELQQFLKRKSCKVFSAPFDVRLPSKNGTQIETVVQPDVCVICDPNKLDSKGCLGAPDIVVEILSPQSTKKDLREKFDLYEENGVLEYWVVYPNDNALEVFVLEDNKYESKGGLEKEDILTTPVLPGLELQLNEVF